MSLMFRDESDEVVRKARARESLSDQKAEYQSVAVVAVTSANPNESHRLQDNLWTQPQIPQSHQLRNDTSGGFLYPTIFCLEDGSCSVSEPNVGEQGARFFMEHYISAGPMSDMPNSVLYGPNPLVFLFGSKMTRDAKICLGLAGLANVRHDQSIMELARSKYASALRQIIEALRNPVETKEDGTFGAVAMLAMFEIITCDQNSCETWAGHMTGAAALLKVRGSNRSVHRKDVRTFVQLCFVIFIKSLQNNENIPADILEWFENSKAYQVEGDLPAWRLASIVSRFVNLRASIKTNELIDPISILCTAASIEADLARWVEELPAEWKFTIAISTENSEAIFDSECHVYHNLWVATLWNRYRPIRILVNELLLSYLDLIPSLPLHDIFGISQNQRRQSRGVISLLATEICHSIPFQLNHNGMAQNNATKLTPTLTGAFTILWPLKVAASTSGASEALSQWARSLLQSIGSKKGIRLALFLKKAIEAQRESRHMDASTMLWANNQFTKDPPL